MGQSDEETPQRVEMTRWGLMGWAPRARRRGKPPMCRIDTLGVDEVGVERGKGRNHPTVEMTRWAVEVLIVGCKMVHNINIRDKKR